MDANLNRRDLFMIVAGAAFATLQLPAAEPNAPLFFTKEEFATLDTLTDLIIPTDDHSPGAHEAGVAAYIDRSVAEAFLPENKTSWRKGLAAVNTLCNSTYKVPFTKATHQQQIALLKRLANKEAHPETDAEKFFLQLKETTAFAYYSSSVGIHQDINYKGNVILEHFVGYEP